LSAGGAAATTSAPALPLATGTLARLGAICARRVCTTLTLAAALRLDRLSLILTALILIAALASAATLTLTLPLTSNLIFRSGHQTELTISHDLFTGLQPIFDDGH
jgi:hypothetical protein